MSLRSLGFLTGLFRGSKTVLWVLLLIGEAGSLIEVTAQRITVLDFSTTVPKSRKHVPKPFPPGMTFGGRCGGLLGNPPLVVSLLSLDRNKYTIGDELIYTLNVSNSGAEPIKIPTIFNLADLEPDDPAASFSYSPMEIWLTMTDSHERSVFVLLLTLYGSHDVPRTEIELEHGESVEIRGKAKLEPTDQTKRVFHDAYGAHSSVPPPHGDVRVVVYFWRGDDFRFEGSTQYEYQGGCPNETNARLYNKKITLAPAVKPVK